MVRGAGASQYLASVDKNLFRVNADGTTAPVADLSAFLMAHHKAIPCAVRLGVVGVEASDGKAL